MLKLEASGGDSSAYVFTLHRRAGNFMQLLGEGDRDTFTVLSSSTLEYRLIVNDGCSPADTSFITIHADSAFRIHASDRTVCKNAPTVLRAQHTLCAPSYTYFWYDLSNPSVLLGTADTLLVFPDKIKTYRLVVERPGGLRDTAAFLVDVYEDRLLSVNTGDTLLCLGDEVQLRALASGGYVPGYRFIWRSEDGAYTDTGAVITVQPDTTTLYKVFLEDGCTPLPDSVSVLVRVQTPLKLSLNGDTTVCHGRTLTLQAYVTGGAAAAYRIDWKKNGIILPDTAMQLPVLMETTSTYHAGISNGCGSEDSASVTVTVRLPLEVSLNADTTICSGESIRLLAAASGGYAPQHKFTWSNGSGELEDTLSVLALTPSFTTTYRVRLDDDCTAISDSAAVTVTVRPGLELGIVPDTTVCEGSEVRFSATANGGYAPDYRITWSDDSSSWQENGFSPSRVFERSGLIRAILEDGCTRDPDTAWTRVMVTRKPVAAFSAEPDSGCVPLEVIFTDLSQHHDPGTQIWHLGDESVAPAGWPGGSHVYGIAGNYTVSLKVSSGPDCTDSVGKRGAVTVWPRPSAAFDFSPEYAEMLEEVRFFSKGSGASGLWWNFGNGSSGDGREVSHAYRDTGIYLVEMIAENSYGCRDTAMEEIRIHEPFSAFIPSSFSPNGDGLNDVFVPASFSSSGYQLLIVNRWGQVILDCMDCSWDGTYLGAPAPDGLYLFQLAFISEKGRRYTYGGTITLVR